MRSCKPVKHSSKAAACELESTEFRPYFKVIRGFTLDMGHIK